MMKRAALGTAMLLGAACLFSGCAGDSGTTPREARSIRGTIASATSVELFEGLPHQMFERDMLEHEKRTKSTITLDNFSFYATSLELSDADRDWVRSWVANDANLVAFGGEKKCGGFHPDYCVVWRTGERNTRTHLCFGCGEVKFVDDTQTVRLDISARAANELRDRLNAYRKNRPARRLNRPPSATQPATDSSGGTP